MFAVRSSPFAARPSDHSQENSMSTFTPVALPDAPPPRAPYSAAVKAGPFVYVSGQTPRDHLTGEVVGNDVTTQTRQTLSNVQRLVEAAGATMSNVISVTVYLTNVDDWATMNSVYTEFFTAPFPTRTAVGVDLRDIMVEISAVAYVGA